MEYACTDMADRAHLRRRYRNELEQAVHFSSQLL